MHNGEYRGVSRGGDSAGKYIAVNVRCIYAEKRHALQNTPLYSGTTLSGGLQERLSGGYQLGCVRR